MRYKLIELNIYKGNFEIAQIFQAMDPGFAQDSANPCFTHITYSILLSMSVQDAYVITTVL